jgi:hypothetical protein
MTAERPSLLADVKEWNSSSFTSAAVFDRILSRLSEARVFSAMLEAFGNSSATDFWTEAACGPAGG